MDADDLALFERSLRHATASSSGRELDDALRALGWHEALEVDERASVSLLFTLQGTAGATSDALGHVMATALGLGGETPAVLPAIDRSSPPGELDGAGLRVRGLAHGVLAERPETLVVASRAGTTVAATVPTAALVLRPVHGIDPWAELVEVTADHLELADAPTDLGDTWSTAVARGRLALAHELVGTSRRMLELAREHALERVQFGRPIARFQAVRHRLAETLVAIETAEAAIDAAWLDGSLPAAAMAKAVAGREARIASKHCQQVLAGIGFTTEHDLHRFVRRALVLDGLLGTSKSITAALGRELAESRRLPPLLPL